MKEKLRSITQKVASKTVVNKCLVRCVDVLNGLTPDERKQVRVLCCVGFLGDSSRCARRWKNTDVGEWKHYVLNYGDTVFDPTIAQIDEGRDFEFSLDELGLMWSAISEFLLPPGIVG